MRPRSDAAGSMRLSEPACPVVSASGRKEDSTHHQPDSENREECHRGVDPPKPWMFGAAEGTPSYSQRSNQCKHPKGRLGDASGHRRWGHWQIDENHARRSEQRRQRNDAERADDSADRRRNPPDQVSSGPEMHRCHGQCAEQANRTVIGKRSNVAAAGRRICSRVQILSKLHAAVRRKHLLLGWRL